MAAVGAGDEQRTLLRRVCALWDLPHEHEQTTVGGVVAEQVLAAIRIRGEPANTVAGSVGGKTKDPVADPAGDPTAVECPAAAEHVRIETGELE
jgi:hypothetical protein